MTAPFTRTQCIALLRAVDSYDDNKDSHWSDADLKLMVANRRTIKDHVKHGISDELMCRVINELHEVSACQ